MATVKAQANADGRVQARPGPSEMVVIFHLADETYGVPAASVQTVVRPLGITPVPRAESYVEGVVNLRGEIVPVVDMRRHFGLPCAQPTEETRLIVIVPGNFKVAVIADRVSGVVSIPDEEIQQSGTESPVSDDFIRGVVQYGGHLLTVLKPRVIFGQGRVRYPGAHPEYGPAPAETADTVIG